MTVGERIKNRREELMLSQTELAKKMGVSRQAISKAELHDSYITTDKVTKFSKALDVSIAYLMGWDDEEKVERPLNSETALEDAELLTKYAMLSDSDKKLIMNMIDSLLNKH